VSFFEGKVTFGKNPREVDREKPARRFEPRITRRLLGVWRTFARRAREILSESTLAIDLPINLPDEFWADLREAQREALAPLLSDVIRAGVDAARATPIETVKGVLIDWALVNRWVERWARAYEYQLITGITETTKRQTQAALGDWIAEGEDFPSLIQRIQEIFNNPVRAEMIAATEATRVYAKANAEAWAAQGVQPAIYTPPAHPRCRCYVQPKRLAPGVEVIVWYTGRDELVCTQPLQTPWGEIAGCQGMHKRVISGGEYGGLSLDEAVAMARGRA
jgi:hypothetical protein